MGPVIRLDEYDLVLVGVVQGPRLVLLDGEVEDGPVRLHLGDEVRVLPVICRNDVRPSETKLWIGASWQKHRAVVDRDRDDLLARLGVQEALVP